MFHNIIITFGYVSKIDYNRTWLVQLYMVHCIPVSFALPLCLSFLAYYLLKLGHCDSRCRCRFPGPSEGPSCNFIALCLYHMLLFCSLSLCTLCMYFYLFASHVFRFVSFYFVCYVLLSFPFCISLHLPHATKNSMEILFFSFFYFVSFWLVLGHPKSWFTFARQRQLFLHTNNSLNISASRPAHCSSLPLSPSRGAAPSASGFWEPVSHFLSSQFGFRFFFFFVFDFTLFFLYAVVKFLPCCVAVPRRIYQHLIG